MPLDCFFFGLVLAFKEFNFSKGIWKSDWCGLNNFKYLFMVGDTAWRLTRNTVGYYLLFTLVGTIGNVAIDICINEMFLKKAAKLFQSCMILPNFISYIAVSFVVYAFLKSDTGIVNKLLVSMGESNVSFYLEAEYWPLILFGILGITTIAIAVCITFFISIMLVLPLRRFAQYMEVYSGPNPDSKSLKITFSLHL